MSSSAANDTIDAFKCAKCGYDLRGQSLESQCPECAFPIRRSRAAFRAQWTPAIGIRRALTYLLIAIPLSAAIIFGALWACGAPLNWLSSNAAPRAMWAVALLTVPLAVPVIWLLWNRLQTAAGFSGILVLIASLLATTVAAFLGAHAATSLVGVAASATWVVAGTVIFVAIVWVTYSHLTD